MSSWASSRTSDRRAGGAQGSSVNFDDDNDGDHWKDRAAKHMKKSATSAKPDNKPRQKTLAQSISDKDMDQLFGKYRSGDQDNEEGTVDYSRFLEDEDSSDASDGSSNEEDAPTADKLLDILMTTGKATKMERTTEKPPVAKDEGGAVMGQSDAPVVPLHDEQFDYASSVHARHQQKAHHHSFAKSDGPPGASKGSSYLSIDTPQEKIQLTGKLEAPTVLEDPHDRCGHIVSETAGPFYWFDAKEQPHTLSVDPGSVFLFGKMLMDRGGKQRYCSCLVRVHNVERCVHLLPNSDSREEDVVKEVNDLCRRQGIEHRRIRFEKKHYAFEEPGIPHEETTWVSLRYSAQYPPFSAKEDMRHIRAVMGASASLLELFLIENKIKGPCFLQISGLTPATSRVSHCEAEFTVDSSRNISVDATARLTPPFTIASIQIHAQLDDKNASNEVFAVTVAVYRDTNVDGVVRSIPNEVATGIRQPDPSKPFPIDLENTCNSKGLPGVKKFVNERKLLIWLASTIGTIDPDILVGHNFLGFTLDTLIRRFQELSVPGWSTLGRLDLKRFPRLQGSAASNLSQEKEVCVGRLVADSYILSREYFKSVNYKLSALADEMHLQGIAKGKGTFEPGSTTLTPEVLLTSQSIFDVLVQIANCAVLSVAVVTHLDAIRLTKRLSTIAGNLWSRTLYGARSERIEFLLLHSFNDLGFILPDKKAFDFKRNRDEDGDAPEEGKRKAKYQGGMVLDPKCGLYSDYILLLDFNSLYPSLIQEFNICFTTVDRYTGEDAEIPPPENLVCKSCAAAGHSAPCQHKCILPKVIKGLVDSRREVKRLMKTEKEPNNLALLEIRQKALKLTANSMYGCLGFEHSRFYAQPLAELVTRQGRLALQNTVELIPQIDPVLRVIYGDTDSVMIQTGIKNDIKRVRDLGLELKTKINKNYQSLEIDIDGVFRAILLLKKKKYAAISVVDWQDEGRTLKREVKGLDMVRRDWCPLSKKVSDAVLSRVLNADGGEDILGYIMNYMHDVAEHVRAGDRYTLDDFVISKSLTKEPESYKGTAFPHATVAQRMKSQKMLVRVGDLIPYVVCNGEKLADKAYHVDEVRESKTLRVDAEWYLSAQIYPPVMRLCEHIQGFSNAHLSEAMGIAYSHAGRNDDDNDADAANRVDDFSHCRMFKRTNLSECFETAVPLQVLCTHCHRKSPVDPHKRVEDVVASHPTSTEPFSLYVCANCGRDLPVDVVANSFTQMCYELLRQFYQSGGRAAAVRAIRVQFTYFRALFDVPHAPGCPQAIKDAHTSRARRCLGIDRDLYTLAQAAVPAIKDQCDPVDPLHAAADSFYRRIDHLFINLDSLFA